MLNEFPRRRKRLRPLETEQSLDDRARTAWRAPAPPACPLGMAEIALAPWTRHLRHDPADPGGVNPEWLALSPTATARCCRTLPGTTRRWGRSRGSGSCAAARRAIPSAGSRRASKPPRAPRAGPRRRGRHGAGRAAAGRGIQAAGLPGRRPSHVRLRRRRVPHAGASRKRRRRWPAHGGCAGSSSSATTMASRSMARSGTGSPMTPRRASAHVPGT